ncbi:MAG: leucine-rich repeat domain-containing protein [Ruminiclostridium sp.]|nr:leucine-rich repeat domain-containing protein [Ruminiclostridium sp.]
MKQTKHKILSVFLSLCMIISCMVGMTVTASALPPISGECGAEGNNVTWEYNSTSKTLTISGTGAMKDFNSAPDWSTYRPNIEKIDIDSGVTSIGKDAFTNCSSLTSVDIPNSVTSIGNSAFSSCSSLTSVTIPEGVKSIGNGAFFLCTALTSVDIPSTVTSIGNNAFRECTALTSVDIPSSVTSIGQDAFNKCASLTSVTIPDSVTSIGGAAFYYCSSLESMTIPSSVTSIGSSTFDSCSSLTSVTIPGSVTSIGFGAFRSCTVLTSVTIPGSVTSIGKETFYDCSNLATVTFERVSETDAIAGKTLAIGEDAFNGTKSGAKVAYGTGDTVLYDNDTPITTETLLTAIQDKTLTWKAPSAKAWTNGNVIAILDGTKLTVAKKSAEQPGAMENNGWTAVGTADDWDDIAVNITELEIQNGVTSIGQGAFINCTNLTSVTIPSSVTSIGLGAFNNCTSLTSVTIPNSVTSIGDYAFKSCEKLATVTFEPRSTEQQTQHYRYKVVLSMKPRTTQK